VNISGEELQRLQTGTMTGEEWQRIVERETAAGRPPMHIGEWNLKPTIPSVSAGPVGVPVDCYGKSGTRATLQTVDEQPVFFGENEFRYLSRYFSGRSVRWIHGLPSPETVAAHEKAHPAAVRTSPIANRISVARR
jgi:hypothetical protein